MGHELKYAEIKTSRIGTILATRKNHCLVYISICFPDGTACIRGPINGCHNDLGALDILGLNDEGIRNEITTDAFVLGGDGIFL